MGKIGDLWVRLGLKSDDYKKGMNAAKKQTSSFAGGLDKMKAGALAVWAAVGAAVTKFAKDFISATNTINDKWQATMSGIKASYQSVLADMATYKPDFSSFSNFFKNEWNWIKKTFGNAKEAGEAAKEMTKAFDAEFELVNSVKLQKAMIQEELNDLYVKMRDTTLSPADRQAAAERYKALLQPLADAEVRIYGNMMEMASKAWQAGAGLSREYSTNEMRDFFANYGVDPEGTAAKYSELASVYENRKGDTQNQVIFDILTRWEQANAQMSDVNKVLSRTTNSIKKELQTFDLNLAEELEGGLQDVFAEIDAIDFSEIDLEFPEIDLSAFDKAIEELKAKGAEWLEEQQKIAELNQAFSNTLANSLSGGVQAFTNMLFNLDGADATQVLSALMQPFADTAVQLGTMLIAQGTAVEAFNKSLMSLQGAPAIAAGVALVAIGSAMRAGIQSLAKGGSSASTASTYDSGAYDTNGTTFDNYDSTIQVEVYGRISGSDILIAGSNQQKKWNR
jgi:hypothetical protein